MSYSTNLRYLSKYVIYMLNTLFKCYILLCKSMLYFMQVDVVFYESWYCVLWKLILRFMKLILYIVFYESWYCVLRKLMLYFTLCFVKVDIVFHESWCCILVDVVSYASWCYVRFSASWWYFTYLRYLSKYVIYMLNTLFKCCIM